MLRCTYCGWVGSAVYFVWDHVMPLARGGADAPHNKVLACRRCNWQKGARTALEYIVWRRANPIQANVGPY
jgi:5-methylcytosine-specific restriction endonuclease McrA